MSGKSAIEFQLLDGTVLVGSITPVGYVGIYSYENELFGIWGACDVLAVNNIDRQIFYKCGTPAIQSNSIN